MRNIKHIFFDLDRTLWDFEINSHLTLVEIFNELRLKEKLAVESEIFIKEYKRINELFWSDYRDGTITKEELRHARFETTLKYFGLEDATLAAAMGESYITQSPRKTALVNGTIELLDYLKPKYELHIITNGFSEVQHIKLKESGLEPYFKEVVISENVGFQKPHINVFRFAEKATGSTPENSIMIGDHYDADIIGALGAGWKSIYFEPEEVEFEQHENLNHVKSLRAITELL
ncbi:MAG: YjjG family noncanonical pyrimidine nucleotidase [Flavobacteriales bacterium]|nr:YjjG family noncanonical pyrimidine nucleotidase [Flavobacteriales bacterium]